MTSTGLFEEAIERELAEKMGDTERLPMGTLVRSYDHPEVNLVMGRSWRGGLATLYPTLSPDGMIVWYTRTGLNTP